MPNPQPTFVIDSKGRRHVRGTAEYEAILAEREGAPDDAPYMHRPTAGEPAREE